MSWSPFMVDIQETDKSYLIDTDPPDIKKENVNVDYNNGYLTISTKREEKRDDIKVIYVRCAKHDPCPLW